MVDAQAPGRGEVQVHAAQPGRVAGQAEEHGGHRQAPHHVDARVEDADVHQDQAVEQRRVHDAVLVLVGEQQHIAVVTARGHAGRQHELGQQRPVRAVLHAHREADGPRSRRVRRAVAEGGDAVEDAAPGRCRDGAFPADDVGDGADRDAGMAGHVLDPGHACLLAGASKHFDAKRSRVESAATATLGRGRDGVQSPYVFSIDFDGFDGCRSLGARRPVSGPRPVRSGRT